MRRPLILLPVLAMALASCSDLSTVEDRLTDLENRMTAIEEVTAKANSSSITLKKFFSDKILITDFKQTKDGYTLSLSDATEVEVTFGTADNCIVPLIAVDESGNWVMSVDGGKTFTKVRNSQNIHSTSAVSPLLQVDAEGFWTVSTDGGKTYERVLDANGKPISAIDGRAVSGKYSFFNYVDYNSEKGVMDFILSNGLQFSVPVENDFGVEAVGYEDGSSIHIGETVTYLVNFHNTEDCFFDIPEGWSAKLTDSEIRFTAPAEGSEGMVELALICTSDKGLLKRQKFQFHFYPFAADQSSCKPWNDYLEDNGDNVLLDFSYAGYMHGEVAPPDVYTLGYKVYNVCDYGAIPNDGLSDRNAFLSCLKDAFKVDVSKTASGIQFGENKNAKVIIYFPEGEFLLHTEEDNNEDGTTSTILIRSGNWVLKGAGRGKTILRTTAPGFPGEQMSVDKPWSGIPLMTITCWNGPADFAVPVTVTENVKKGSHSVKVNSTAGIAKDAWVQLTAVITDQTYLENQLQPYGSNDLKNSDFWLTGAKIYDYHQVKEVGDGVVTFYEPVMYDINASYGFTIKNYLHYENVGIEDLTFASCTPGNYLHHGSYLMDSGYSMVWTRRLVNSWIRRVDFDSVTEGMTFEACANCSAYDMECYGVRGHAMVRAASASRIFIGATYDHSDGLVNDSNNPKYASRSFLEGAGQLHGQGVNGFCIGSVCWRNTWGLDACFESHAQQPRASLFDCCKGGWMTYRTGGAIELQPGHLDDLIIWNMNSSTAYNTPFKWWNTGTSAWKMLLPTIIGFHGEPCTFIQEQVRMDYSNGTAVDPESLYEAQIRRRLGFVPAWLNSIRTLYPTQ